MAENNINLWAPWRMSYIKSLQPQDNSPSCFLCQYWATPELDAEHYVVYRSTQSLVVLNLFPYTGGHVLVAPSRHVPQLTQLSNEEHIELSCLITQTQMVLDRLLHPEGYNIGMNIGRVAGAGLPDHIHYHLVPRWSGDTNFMSNVGGVRVISNELRELHQQMSAAWSRSGSNS
ncbi:MAG: AP-4-A phosphorylase [Phycisphaerae bacterium]|nr:AP-4-A phosphorylase [Phycisphaerae bacterium]